MRTFYEFEEKIGILELVLEAMPSLTEEQKREVRERFIREMTARMHRELDELQKSIRTVLGPSRAV